MSVSNLEQHRSPSSTCQLLLLHQKGRKVMLQNQKLLSQYSFHFQWCFNRSMKKPSSKNRSDHELVEMLPRGSQAHLGFGRFQLPKLDILYFTIGFDRGSTKMLRYQSILKVCIILLRLSRQLESWRTFIHLVVCRTTKTFKSTLRNLKWLWLNFSHARFA